MTFGRISAAEHSANRKLSRAEIEHLAQAIDDEIYDYGYEGDYFPVGGTVGDAVSESRTLVPLYIDPVIDDGEGRIIYKLMPYGEVLRLFHIRSDGTIVLDGDPEIGFPASQPDRKTVYLRDEDVSRMKRNWMRSSFQVLLSPGIQRIEDAARRQQRRTGFSRWRSTHQSSGGGNRR